MRRRNAFRNICYCIFPALVLVVILESCLRLAGYPKAMLSPIYRKNATILAAWGPIPYVVETNSLGLRGPEIAVDKPAGTIRIAALGDSITDGFFVDNPDTYPLILQGILRDRGMRVEVINAARGDISIYGEYEILREVVMPLDPDIVLLTFVANDVSDLRGKSRSDFLHTGRGAKRAAAGGRVQWFVTGTAIGGALFDLSLRLRFASYRAGERNKMGLGADRYRIERGDDYSKNVKVFAQKCAKTDGMVLNEPFSSEAKALIDDYLFALQHVKTFCLSRKKALVLVYFPSYSQVYDLRTSIKIRDVLQGKCNEFGIPFVDLTPAFRRIGRVKVLHLAPVDFHPNPEGNRVMADTIARFLIAGGFLE